MIPAEVRALAEDPTAHGPIPPGFERILDDRFCFFLGPSSEMTMAQRLRLEEGAVAATVEEVRGLARERERSWLTWWVTDSSTPGGLETELRGLGMEPAAVPIHEPEYTALALTRPPPDETTSLTTRRVVSFDEYLTATEIGWTAFEQTEEQREAMRPALPLLFELQERGVSACYLAFLEGRPVAMANAVFADAGVMLLGGAVLPEARGRGCYRALVHERWEDAVSRGTPALVVQAGAMSRPILERLGFERVATLRVLVDRFA
jgi:hypothetical protein